MHLEKFNRNKSILTSITEAYGLQIRGTSGEKTRVDSCVFDISNRRRLGITETDIVKNLHQGLLAIIDAEKRL
jgi:arginine kinase